MHIDERAERYAPVYVRRYEVTTQSLISKPCKSSVIETSAVLTIVLSIVDRKREIQML